jgi:polyribonucleotide nucleotidyltransferase
MISDITAVPEIGKTYLGKVVRIAEFGAFVEIFPGTDGLLHVSEIAEHRVKEVKDELREGDQILVKVLSIEGNRIKLSRKAVLREQRAKLGLPEVGEGGAPQGSAYPAPIEADEAEDGDETVLAEGGGDFEDDDVTDSDSDLDEPNFNNADGAPVPATAGGGRAPGGPSGFRGPGGPGGPGGGRPGGRRRRGGGGRRPGGPGGSGGAPQGGGGNR